MSLEEITQSGELKKPVDTVFPPLGNVAVQGFNGSGDVRSHFLDQTQEHVRVNGFKRPLARSIRTEHFITRDREGQSQVRTQNVAEILGLLDGYIELSAYLGLTGEAPSLQRFTAIIDCEEDFVLADNLEFLEYIYSPGNGSQNKVPTGAIFYLHELHTPQAGEQLAFNNALDQPPQQMSFENILNIPISQIYHLAYAAPAG